MSNNGLIPIAILIQLTQPLPRLTQRIFIVYALNLKNYILVRRKLCKHIDMFVFKYLRSHTFKIRV